MPPKAKGIDSELESLPKAKAAFIEPMLLLRTGALPEAAEWLYELKLDGYRALAIKSTGRVQLRSRNDNDFSVRYPAIVRALASLPSETVIDGEAVGLDESGRPSFNILQNYGSSKGPILYYVFDLLVLAGRDVMGMPLSARRELLDRHILSKLGEPIRESPELRADLKDLVASIRAQGFEGLVAKRRDSRYEPGERSGAWQKMLVKGGQELVIAGYTPSPKSFDALIIGYYEGAKLMYAARTRNGFTPASRAELFKKLKPLEIQRMPFFQSAGSQERALGRRVDGCEDG
jgi:ATP-dependent DNA ligase